MQKIEYIQCNIKDANRLISMEDLQHEIYTKKLHVSRMNNPLLCIKLYDHKETDLKYLLFCSFR